LSNISIVAISVGLPVAVNNPVPASQVGFQQFRATERFCVECRWLLLTLACIVEGNLSQFIATHGN